MNSQIVPARQIDPDHRRDPTMTEEPPERSAIQIQEHASRCRRSRAPSTSSVVPSPRSFNSRAHINGVSVSDTRPGRKNRNHDRDRKLAEDSSHEPVMNTSGMNTAASEIVIDMIVKLISFALLMAASKPAHHAPFVALCFRETRSRRQPGSRSPVSAPSTRGCRGCNQERASR